MVALSSDDGECSEWLAADPFGGSFDGVGVVESDESCGDVSECCYGLWSASGMCLVRVLVPCHVSDVMAFILDSPMFAHEFV